MVATAEKEKVAGTVQVEYHADDFGLFLTQSERILACHRNGLLNGISVMPNSDFLAECIERYEPVRENIAVTVHLNLIEGRALCDPAEIPLLVDTKGIFTVSFGKLLLRSYLPGRKAYRQQLKKELRAQIHAVKAYLDADAPVRLDGHAHYHMLPVVFDALMDVIREEQLDVSYIRIPREYLSLYLPHWKQLRDFSPINLVKVLILNFLSWRNRGKYGEFLNGLEQRLFMGVFLSGSMHGENVAHILPDAIRLAEKKGWGLEILAHPGGVYEDEDVKRLTNADDVAFLTSPARGKESSLFQFDDKSVMR